MTTPTRLLSALLAVLTLTAALSAQSFSARKRAFEEKFASKDHNTRVAAIKEISTHGHPETVRFLLDVNRRVTDSVTEARANWAEATLARTTARREVARLQSLVQQGKIGKRKLERAQATLKAAEAVHKKYKDTIDRDSKIGVTIRRGIGWALSNCDDQQKRNAERAIKSAYRKARSASDRVDLLRVMVWSDVDTLFSIVVEETKHREAPTRVAALRAIEERGGRMALRPAIACMKDPSWQVRAQAIRMLRLVGGAEAAKALCNALENEEGRLVTDAVNGLRKLTGQNFHDNVHLWREWLDKHGGELPKPTEVANAAPVGKPAVADGGGRRGGRGRGGRANRGGHKGGGGTGFYGIDTKSKHIVYVIDYSGSMAGPLGGNGRMRGGGGGGPRAGREPAKIGGKRKVDGVATELLKSIDSLPKDGTFNVVLFESGVTVWKDKMVPATQANKAAIRKWVLARGPGGATDLFGGVERGFKFAGRGTFDKYYRSAVDTIFLLSDGSPSAGRIQATGEIIAEVKKINDLKRISLHCVGLGRGINARFLRRLAEENDGEFVHVTR